MFYLSDMAGEYMLGEDGMFYDAHLILEEAWDWVNNKTAGMDCSLIAFDKLIEAEAFSNAMKSLGFHLMPVAVDGFSFRIGRSFRLRSRLEADTPESRTGDFLAPRSPFGLASGPFTEGFTGYARSRGPISPTVRDILRTWAANAGVCLADDDSDDREYAPHYSEPAREETE